jgi:cyclin G-associated kinase
MKWPQFLQLDPQNIVIVHCIDGKTNSAVLVSALLLACRFVASHHDAVKFFELKRCAPHLDNYHVTLLKYAEKAFAERQVVTRSVTINSLILEPVPIFTKQGDGCKPYVQIVRNNQASYHKVFVGVYRGPGANPTIMSFNASNSLIRVLRISAL